MKVTYKKSIKYKVEQRIKRMRSRIILRSDLADIAAYRQISRALSQLVKEAKLAKIGKGVYVKMRASVVTGDPVLDGAFMLLAREALDKLGVAWEPESAEKEYNSSTTTQIPVSSRVRLKSRFNRKIRWGDMELKYE